MEEISRVNNYMADAEEWMMNKLIAVSYTHLDVYKRQKGQWAGKIAPMCFFTTRFPDEEVQIGRAHV